MTEQKVEDLSELLEQTHINHSVTSFIIQASSRIPNEVEDQNHDEIVAKIAQDRVEPKIV